MTIDAKKICSTHTKEKEKSGTCCQLNEDQDRAEQQTYEQSFLTMGVKNSEIQSFKNMEGTKAGPQTGAERS